MQSKITIAAIGTALIGLFVLLVTTPITLAQTEILPTPSDYGELLTTEIRGMDEATIEGLRTGAGVGFALPAELNGYPGPRHVLDLVSEMDLTETQEDEIQALFDEMEPRAIELGVALLNAEADLEEAFRLGTIDETFLEAQLAQIANIRGDLRFVHLQTHLDTIEILTPHQVTLYNRIRGYDLDGQPNAHGQHGN
jgi:Spy/CpxP family protein refolding chaperone